MRFEEALQAMREGKKVTRKHYTYKKISEIKEHFWLDEVMAEDWEVLK